ncbi:MAG: hypothetical protein Q9228_001679 [Teloschistes exilis]
MKQFFTEDFMLAFAVICLCGSTALVVASLQEQYDELAVILHSSTFDPTLEFIEKLPKTLAMNNAASTLWWLVIFPVKLAFFGLVNMPVCRDEGDYQWVDENRALMFMI